MVPTMGRCYRAWPRGVSPGPILSLKTIDPSKVTVRRDQDGLQSARGGGNPEIVLIQGRPSPFSIPFDGSVLVGGLWRYWQTDKLRKEAQCLGFEIAPSSPVR
jgi:hypothetical protein